LGGVLWVGVCIGAGYLFGNIPAVKNNFSLVALGIVAVSMLPVQQTVQSAGRVFGPEHSRPDVTADRVIDGVAENGGKCKQQEKQADVERAGRGQRAGGEEQRVARQKGRDDQSGLREDDREEPTVHPHAVPADELREMDVEMKEEIDERLHVSARFPRTVP
jgi:hypothetical protein